MALQAIKKTITPSSPQVGRRNIIINGGMKVAQRGTTMSAFSASNGAYFTLDRWACWGSGGTYKIEQYPVPIDEQHLVAGQTHFARFSVDTGNDNVGMRQYIEGVHTIPSNEWVTVSFYARGINPGGGEIETLVQNNYGTTGSAQVEIPNSDVRFTLTSDWQRFTFTFQQTSHVGLTVDTSNDNIRLQFKQKSGDVSSDSWYMDITGVQMELGTEATPFENRTFSEELLACQRYYYKTGNPGSPYEWFPGSTSYAANGNIYAQGFDGNQDRASVTALLPTTMRVEPTMVFYPGRGGVANTAGNITVYNGDTLVTFTGSPYIGGSTLSSYFSGTSTDSAAYSFNFTADAELV